MKTEAFVDMVPLFEQLGIEIESLPSVNRLYPAVYEEKQVFLRVSPGRVPSKDPYVGFLNRENLTDACELAYYLAMSGSRESLPANYDQIWRGEFAEIVREFFLLLSSELYYHNFLHPDLQEYWTAEQFESIHQEMLEMQFRYVSSAFPDSVQRTNNYTSRYTGKKYEVVEAEITLRMSIGNEPDETGFNTEVTYLFFTIVDGRWRLIL
ncbi:MAG: hypothetical protein PHV61_10550 [Limnochordia bacterium]|nr:hypothetical protein [Limnochordia bacterium]MDD2630582.1 hypothetical protein [Limnochordia bacterium]MDD4517966.1 hypothetical protein [Limnochordia bacterium]